MYALGTGAYSPYVRNHIVQAQYYKDPYELESYYKYNPFLPDINNEIAAARKDHYRSNLAALDRFVMVRFADDFTVVPRDSAWFSWFNGTDLIPLREQSLYQEDWLGLRQMDAQGRLEFEEMPGFHMQIDLKIFIDFLDKYLSRPRDSGELASDRETAARALQQHCLLLADPPSRFLGQFEWRLQHICSA
eukprot:TRINITY_DN18926_c0_g1_i6.p1 TRINITY_DN18926_c0_g1~~TRINITY_DN18926_c0_g1_i6.p1  ORF type:complete len:213 (-),score=13.45 TRINITY_DN18926_c0_g1_i6:50-619(-)